MWSKDFWGDSVSDKLTMFTVLCLLGAQEKPSFEEVPEKTSSQSFCVGGLLRGLPAELCNASIA